LHVSGRRLRDTVDTENGATGLELSKRRSSFMKLGPRWNQQWMSPVMRWAAEPVFRDAPEAEPLRTYWVQDAGERARRVLNLTVAATSLLLASPLFLAIALAVKLSSRGPVFFRQERVGQDRRRRPGDRRVRNRGGSDRREECAGGKVFWMYKFRTMYVGRGKNRQVWTEKDDPRITPVGRFLRAFRLDELPQLWNVIRGDMNVVGPRPEQPEIFKGLRCEISDYPKRQSILPGITGWAQVNNGYDQSVIDVQRKLGYDLEYLNRRSPAEDLRIMAKTVPVVLGRRGYH
jgi:lipopolysaccharide/colanic/teichoic acid biosynthesis glycosyltransferase